MKINLIYSDDCPHCKELLQDIKNQGGLIEDELHTVELSSEEGQRLAEKIVLEEVPTAVTDAAEPLKCEIIYVDKHVEIICPEEDGFEEDDLEE